MAAMGVAAAVAAGGAIGIIAYQTSCGCYPSSASRVVSVPVKKRSSTTTSLMGEVLCQLPGMLGRTRRHVTLVGDMLMHGSVAGQAEGSIFLRGAEVCKHGKELHVIKDAELAIAIYFDDEEEADFWAKGLSSAVKVSDSLPKLFSMHAREMSKRSEEANASAANAISKLLSLKRRELTEVERKAHNYELVADQKQQEAGSTRMKQLLKVRSQNGTRVSFFCQVKFSCLKFHFKSSFLSSGAGTSGALGSTGSLSVTKRGRNGAPPARG